MRDEGTLRPTILLVAPDTTARTRLERLFGTEYECLLAETHIEARHSLRDDFVEVMVLATEAVADADAALLEDVAKLWPDTICVAMTGTPDAMALPDNVFQVIRDDAPDTTLTHLLSNAVRQFRLQRDNDRLRLEMQVMARTVPAPASTRPADEGLGFEAILRSATSPLNTMIAHARHLASFDVPILLTGATGTGKSTLARAIHDGSLRADKPFFSLNCAGLSDAQIRDELLGVRNNGASRIGLFQKSARGTLYLGGIDTLAASTQLWLARLLMEGAVMVPGHPDPQRLDFRLIAGTQTDLRPVVAAGAFSADLYHACAIGLLTLPALADRGDDIAVLSQHLLFEAAARHGKSVRGLSPEAVAFLRAYDWPGNLRELENEITRMLIFAQDRTLGPDLISRHILQAAPGDHDAAEDAVIAGDGPLKARVEEIEKRILREVLTRLKWNKSRAATELGLSRVGLRAKLDRYGLCPGVVDALGGE